MKVVKLYWEKIRPYRKLTICEGKSGVYIWGFMTDNKYKPYYVGKSSNIAWRLTEHMSNILGGNYSIYNRQSLEFFDKDKIAEYSPETLEDKFFFLKSRNGELKMHIEYMVESFSFTYSEVPDFRLIGRIAEINTIVSIGKDRLINSRGGKPYSEIKMGNLKSILGITLKRY